MGIDNFGHLGTDGREVLKWNLQKQGLGGGETELM